MRTASGIYEIVNVVNGKRYIGSAVTIRGRFAVHRHMLRRGQHHSRKLQASWNKHGEAAFKFLTLLLCSRENLVMYEQIAMDAIRPEYNVCPKAASALGVKWSEEARAKHSERQRANPAFRGRKHTPETIERMRALATGRPSPTKGSKRDPAAVAATAAAHRGKKRSEETRARISAKALGSKKPPRTDEYRAKISAAHKGKRKAPEHMAALQAGRRARVATDAERKAISDALKRAWEDGTRSRVKTEATKAKMSKAFSKLSADQVREMKALHAQGITGIELSARFGTPRSTVSQIVRGLRYRWVE